MIDKIYRCDTCDKIVVPANHDAWRLYFKAYHASNFELRPLITIENASEKIVCKDCLMMYQECCDLMAFDDGDK